MPYYIVKDGQRMGPISDEEFQNRVLTGEIGADTLVWRQGMADWMRHGDLAAGQLQVGESPAPVGAAGVCAECGRTFGQEDLVSIAGTRVCGGCKPLFLQRMREGAMLPSTFHYAGFWVRFAAKAIDQVILYIVNLGMGMAIGGIAAVSSPSDPNQAGVLLFGGTMLLSLAVSIAYPVFFLGKFSATPGKMAMNLRVIRSDGSKITYMRALGRFFGEFISGIIFAIGYIMAAFDDQKRALHDHICDTRVVKN